MRKESSLWQSIKTSHIPYKTCVYHQLDNNLQSFPSAATRLVFSVRICRIIYQSSTRTKANTWQKELPFPDHMTPFRWLRCDHFCPLKLKNVIFFLQWWSRLRSPCPSSPESQQWHIVLWSWRETGSVLHREVRQGKMKCITMGRVFTIRVARSKQKDLSYSCLQ